MKRIVLCWWLVAVPAVAAAGELFSAEGNRSTSPGATVVEIPMAQARAITPARLENGGQLIAKVVTHAETIARLNVDPAATNAQREDLRARKVQGMRQVAGTLLGRTATFSFEVLDVVNRPMPAAPARPKAGASGAEMAAFEAAERAYDDEMRNWGEMSMIVIGRIDRTGRVPESAEYRKKAAALNDEAMADLDAWNRRYSGKRLATPGEPTFAARKKEVMDKLRSDLAKLREEHESRAAFHTVYVLGNNEAFATWKRGQTRACSGTIYRAGMFVYVRGRMAGEVAEGRARGEGVEDFSEAVVAVELAVRELPGAGRGLVGP